MRSFSPCIFAIRFRTSTGSSLEVEKSLKIEIRGRSGFSVVTGDSFTDVPGYAFQLFYSFIAETVSGLCTFGQIFMAI
jgi:hypothetical protein